MRRLLILLLVLGVASIAFGDRTWDNGGGADLNWMNPLNWSGDTLPVNTGVGLDLAKLYKTTGVANMLINSAGPTAWQVKLAGPNPPTSPLTWCTLTVASGGVLDVGEYLMVGIDSTVNRSGQLDMTGGTINLGTKTAVSGHLYLGFAIAGTTGWLNMSGGTINGTADFTISNGAGTKGYAVLSGDAKIYANQLKMNVSGTGTASLNLSGNAQVIINGDCTANVATWQDNGWINDEVQTSLTMNPGKTTLYIPEPATLCLLGIGALSLIRRKR
jgi:hypothetical protein